MGLNILLFAVQLIYCYLSPTAGYRDFASLIIIGILAPNLAGLIQGAAYQSKGTAIVHIDRAPSIVGGFESSRRNFGTVVGNCSRRTIYDFNIIECNFTGIVNIQAVFCQIVAVNVQVGNGDIRTALNIEYAGSFLKALTCLNHMAAAIQSQIFINLKSALCIPRSASHIVNIFQQFDGIASLRLRNGIFQAVIGLCTD